MKKKNTEPGSYGQKANDENGVVSQPTRVLVSVLLATLLLLLANTDSFTAADAYFSDRLFQHPSEPNPEIVVIAITEEDIARYGQWPWDRTVIAKTIRQLNSDRNHRPAVIGVDIALPATTASVSDRVLYYACTTGNVVLSCKASIPDDYLVDPRGSDGKALSITSPLQSNTDLLEVATHAPNNTILDTDGILRHYPAYFYDSDTLLPSFAVSCCNGYRSANNMEIPDITALPAISYIDFSAPVDSYFRYSIGDICDHKFNAEDMAGKIVLIGSADSSIESGYMTAASHRKPMYDVEIQANIIANLLEDVQMREIAPRLHGFLIWLSLAGGIYALFTINIGRIVAVLLLSQLASCALVAMLWANSVLYHPLAFMISLLLSAPVPLLISFSSERYARQQVDRKLSRYMDSSVINEMRTDVQDTNLANTRKRLIAVLFIDIRDFTRYSNQHMPEDIILTLNDFLSICDTYVHANKGTVDKYIGDSVMALWGAASDVDDPAYYACRAALQMKAALEKHFGQMQREEPFLFGIGIDYGEAIIGNVGSKHRMDYTAIGNTVNTASKMQAFARNNDILLTQPVATLLGDRAELEEADPVMIRGKSKPTAAYRLKNIR